MRIPVTGSAMSVVIATRDRSAELARTLRLLTALPERPRIVVVDNASSDGTAAMVASGFPQARLIRLAANAGAVARNVGVRAAGTRYVAFSDDDSWWEPGSLELAARLLDDHPRLGLLAAATLVGPGREPDPVNALMAASPLSVRPDLPGPPVLGFLACASVVRRTAFLEAGGFHPLLFFAGEEALLAMDLAARGWERCYVAELRAVHEPSPVRPSGGRRAVELRNALLTTWLRRQAPAVASETTRLMRMAAYDSDARAAFWAALRRLPRALALRRPVPAGVERELRLLEGSACPGTP